MHHGLPNRVGLSVVQSFKDAERLCKKYNLTPLVSF